MRLIDANRLKALLMVDFMQLELFGQKYKVSDALRTVDNTPTEDAVPIEFIEKRIAELKKLNEYEFIANGGYTSPSDYAQWELERLIRDWREQNANTD